MGKVSELFSVLEPGNLLGTSNDDVQVLSSDLIERVDEFSKEDIVVKSSHWEDIHEQLKSSKTAQEI